MGRRVRALAAAWMMVMALMSVSAAPAGAAATETLADWQMNEGVNASVMVDSSGNGIDGVIGDAVLTGQTVQGETAYTWDNTQPNQPPAKPERLVQVDNAQLNPYSDDYAITVRFRTTRNFGNIIQKGQSGNLGGNWKWQIPSGQLSCTFRGYDDNGNELQKTVNSGAPELGFEVLNDGEWHTVKCERRGDRLIMTIDIGTPQQRVRTANGPTGNIANNVPLTIGGKVNCDQIIATCDYFVGNIDYVLIETGERTPPNESPNASASGSCEFLDCDFGANGSFDPDGTIETYSWDFGDGETGSGFSPSHTYADPGEYTATLTVTDDGGATDTDTVMVTATSQDPEAVFGIDCEWLTCTFDASASSDPDGSIVDYAWDFGDGSDGSGVTATHTYAEGIYDITLVVTDNHGGTDTAEGAVAVSPAPAVHLQNLVPSPYDIEGSKWVARLTVKVRDAEGGGHEGVVVTVQLGAKERTCTTNAAGNCKVKVKVTDSRPKLPAEVVGVDWPGGYDADANKDSDGDGNSETVLIWRPF